MVRRCLVLVSVLFVMLSVVSALAGLAPSPKLPFAISPPKEWVELPLPLQGVLVSYGKKGTLATFHITEREFDEVKSLEQLRWEDLFSPQFGSIDIHAQGMSVLAGEKAKFCIYSLKPGEFKKAMEGTLSAKYINYVLIRRGKLFSVTFLDKEDGFALNYPSFLTAIRTLRFNAPVSITSRRRA